MYTLTFKKNEYRMLKQAYVVGNGKYEAITADGKYLINWNFGDAYNHDEITDESDYDFNDERFMSIEKL